MLLGLATRLLLGLGTRLLLGLGTRVPTLWGQEVQGHKRATRQSEDMAREARAARAHTSQH